MQKAQQVRAPPSAAERLWDLSSDLLGVADRRGRLLTLNSAWQDVLGWSAEELLAATPPDLVHPDDLPLVAEELRRVSSGGDTVGFESRLRARNGEYHLMSWRASADDGLLYLVGRDVTEVRRQEEAVRHAQKMEAVGQLTGGIAHDFNNLLTIIRSAVELLKDPELPEVRRRRYIEAIDEAVERAAKVTQQLLAFARRQRLEPEVFDVGERIADVSELLRQMVGPGVTITTDAPAESCLVEADLCQFETALMNLAINARDAMSGEGQLLIEVRRTDEMPSIRGHAPVSGAFVAVTVHDTGAGIPPDQACRIFEPFFSTKETGKGTGLGLSQVYGFAKQSGGGVSVRSAPGEGAAFTLYLPSTQRAVRGHAPGAERSQGEERRARQGLRALVVEDNEDVGRFCVGLMQDLGYAPDWARNAREALEALEQEGAAYDLVFSDVVMPGMSGIELAERLREERPQMPVLLTSGYSAVLAEEGSRGFPLLPKPYSAEELKAALAAVVADAVAG